MLTRRKPQKETRMKTGMAITVMSIPTVVFINILAQAVVIWMSAQEQFFPGTDMFMSIISTCSEIIAGLYGTTLAGYTFFLSRIDALMASDATLDFVVGSIKKRFKYLIWYITGNVLITLFISVMLMYAVIPDGEQIGYFYRLFCNEFLVFLGFSIVLILYYSVLVIDPNCIEKEAQRLKKRLCRWGAAGSAAEFIALYDEIETVCNSMLPGNVLNQIHENKGRRFEYTIELLSEQEILAPSLVEELDRIHRYYECMINCSPLCVKEEMCALARRVLCRVEEKRKASGCLDKRL